MSLSIAEIVEMLLSAGWRRRFLLVVPILFFAALSILAAFVWPRTYVTRTLLMLQERQVSDPLSSSGGGVTREGRLKAEELDTLLKSERVLTSAILDIHGGKKPPTAREIESEIKSLRRQIGVSVVGSDFIEIELKQPVRDGLGERLSIIMTWFFERLLSREDSMKTARQFALEQRRRDLDTSKAAIDDWLKRAAASGVATDPGDRHVKDLQTRYTALEQKLTADASNLLQEVVTTATLGEAIADEVRKSSARMRGVPNPLPTSPQHFGALRDLEMQLEAYHTLSTELAKAVLARSRAVAQLLLTAQPSAAEVALFQEWQSLDARYTDALAQYDLHQRRSKKASGPSLTPFGLIAPDSIRIIDEPRDPTLPTTSLLKIILACLMAGVGLGVGLSAIAEQLDDRIYSARTIGQISGIDGVFRVPKIEGEGNPRDEHAVTDRPRTRRGHLAIVSDN